MLNRSKIIKVTCFFYSRHFTMEQKKMFMTRADRILAMSREKMLDRRDRRRNAPAKLSDYETVSCTSSMLHRRDRQRSAHRKLTYAESDNKLSKVIINYLYQLLSVPRISLHLTIQLALHMLLRLFGTLLISQ